MKISAKTLLATSAVMFCLAVIGGQASAQHLISSKAGFVNRTDGKVTILRADSLDGERGRASMGTQMRDGDKLMTEQESKAEVLLNPGAYLRMDENCEIIARQTNLTEIRFELTAGTIILEVSDLDRKLPLEIITPNGSVFVRKVGLYRIEALGNSTRLAVRQGEMILGSRDLALVNKGFKIKKGNVANLTSANSVPMLAKLDRDSIDEFDVWSFNRAQALVAANHSALRSSRTYGSLAYGWIFDPIFGTYTFIPRGGLLWSPYGFGFFNSFGNCWTCNGWSPFGWGYNPYGRPRDNNNTGGGGTPNLPPRVIAGNDRAPIQRSMEGRRIDSSGLFDSRGSDGFGSNRGMSMPSSSSSTSVIAAPAPSRGGDAGGASSGGGRPSMPSRP